jgi:hypothetical protein
MCFGGSPKPVSNPATYPLGDPKQAKVTVTNDETGEERVIQEPPAPQKATTRSVPQVKPRSDAIRM